MRRRILLVILSLAVLLMTVPAGSADNTAFLSPSSSLDISDGYIRGIVGIPDAEYIQSQFSGTVNVVLSDGTAVAGESPVPSDSLVCADGTELVRILVPGDCSRDAAIDLADVSAMLKYIAGWDINICVPAADVDDGGKVNLADVTTLLKYIAGWDISLCSPIILDVTFDDYVLLANDPDTDRAVVDAVKNATGKDVKVVTEAVEGVNYITVGKNLWEKCEDMDSVRCKALFPENAYIEVLGRNVYLTACGDKGIEDCVEFLASGDGFSVPKGYKGTLGRLTGESDVLYAEAVSRIEKSGLAGGMTDDVYTALVNAEYTEPKNIIMMIGDGMGRGAVNAARIIYSEVLRGGTLAMMHMPSVGSSQTYSDKDQYTDSAAGATALATGYKTSEGTVAMSSDDGTVYKSVLEIAAEKGKSTGVVATKFLQDATPAAYTAHSHDRGTPSDIGIQQLQKLSDGTLDILLGGGWERYENEIVSPTLEEARSKGVTYTRKWSTAVEAELPLAGVFAKGDMITTPGYEPSLAHMTELALEKLSEDEDGFFLMVEGSQIDSYAHNNEFEKEVAETYNFDCAVAVVLRFVALHPDTVVIVTADHETGGLRVNPAATAEDIYSTSYYLMKRHHWANVPVYSIGYGTGVLADTVENTDIGIFVAGLMGESVGAESVRHTLFDMKDAETVQRITDVYPEFAESADEGLYVVLGKEHRTMSLTVPQEIRDYLNSANVRTVNITYKNEGDTVTTMPSLTLVGADGSETGIDEWWNFIKPGEYFTQSYVIPVSMIGEGKFSSIESIRLGGSLNNYKHLTITDITVVSRPAGQ